MNPAHFGKFKIYAKAPQHVQYATLNMDRYFFFHLKHVTFLVTRFTASETSELLFITLNIRADVDRLSFQMKNFPFQFTIFTKLFWSNSNEYGLTYEIAKFKKKMREIQK